MDISKYIILTDMDGTFLPSSKKPSVKNLEAVNRFQQDGGHFSIATGRALQAAWFYFDIVKVNFPAILCNGGLVYDVAKRQGKMNIYVPKQTRDITQKILDDNKNIGCEILTISNVYVPQMNEAEREHNGICHVEPTLVTIDEIETDNWYKVLFADDAENIDKLERYVSQQNFVGVDFVRSSEKYFEILPRDISKGYAVKFLKKNYAEEDAVVICVGDYYNDLEMLEAADIAICPSNAVDEVKAVCDIVLEQSCEEDAIAAVIDYIYKQIN